MKCGIGSQLPSGGIVHVARKMSGFWSAPRIAASLLVVGRCHGWLFGVRLRTKWDLCPLFLFSESELLAIDCRNGLHRSAVEVTQ